MENLILIDKEYIIYEVSNIIKNIIPIMLNELNLEFSPYIFIENIPNNNSNECETFAFYSYKVCSEIELLKSIKTGYERKPFLLSKLNDTITLNLNFILDLFKNNIYYHIKRYIIFLLSHEMRHYWQNENGIFLNELYINPFNLDQKTYDELRCESDANNFAYYFIRKYAIEIINI